MNKKSYRVLSVLCVCAFLLAIGTYSYVARAAENEYFSVSGYAFSLKAHFDWEGPESEVLEPAATEAPKATEAPEETPEPTASPDPADPTDPPASPDPDPVDPTDPTDPTDPPASPEPTDLPDPTDDIIDDTGDGESTPNP